MPLKTVYFCIVQCFCFCYNKYRNQRGGDKMQISEKKKITNNRYLAKCAQISLKPRQEDAAKIKAAAADAGQSVQGYILQACTERMERDGFTPPAAAGDDQPGND